MSLEATLQHTNTLLEALLTRMNTVASAPAEIGAESPAEVTKRTRAKKNAETPAATAPATTAVIAGAAATTGLNIVDVSRWVHIPAHNTVAHIAAGQPFPSQDGAVEVSEAQFQILDAQYKAARAAPAATATVATVAPAVAAAVAVAAAAAAPAATVTDVNVIDFKTVTDKLMALSKLPGTENINGEAHPIGRLEVLGVLGKFLPNEATRTVPMLAKLSNYSEIAAFADERLAFRTAPAAAVDLFA